MAVALNRSEPKYSAGVDASTLTTLAFTPNNAGDIIVVKCATWDSSVTMSTPSGGGLTYTLQQSGPTSGFKTWVAVWTAVVGTPASMTVSSGIPTANCRHSMVVEVWSGATVGPNFCSPNIGTVGNAVINTTGTNSIMSWVLGDSSSQDPAGRVYNSNSGQTTVTEDGLYDGHLGSNSVHYFAYQTAPFPNIWPTGLTTPSTNWSVAGIELVPSAGPSVSVAATFNGSGTLSSTVVVQTPPTLVATFNGSGTYANSSLRPGLAQVATFNGVGYFLPRTNTPVGFGGEGVFGSDVVPLLPDAPQVIAFVQIGKQTGYGTVRSPHNLKYPTRLPFGDYASIESMKARLRVVNSTYYTDAKIVHMTLNDIIHALIEQDAIK
jgi:hypothetical protein